MYKRQGLFSGLYQYVWGTGRVEKKIRRGADGRGCGRAVSYTHLDVYKRQVPDCFTFYLLSQYPLPWQPGRTLLDMIMHRGKINLSLIHI